MSNAFIDLRCKDCNARFGFSGDLAKTKQIRCPKCGHKIKHKAIRELQKMMEETVRSFAEERKKKAKVKDPGFFNQVNEDLIAAIEKKFQHVKDQVLREIGDTNEINQTSNAWDMLINLFYIPHPRATHRQICGILAECLEVPVPRVWELYREIKQRKTPERHNRGRRAKA